ncbi:MAG: helix-turn-helix domain-containing protein [Vampirovibrionia bacterium]
MKKELPKTLARRLQFLRESNNLTIENLAKKSRVKAAVINDIEEGRESFLSVTTRQNLSTALKVPASVLKEVEKIPQKAVVDQNLIDNIKYNILSGQLENNKCPKCNSNLSCKIITLYDLEDQAVQVPKARCQQCPFQIK